MLYEWDETKRRKNITIHGVDFSAVESFEWESAVIRQGHPERLRRNPLRAGADRRPFTLHAFHPIRGNNLRIISLRKANEREVKTWLGK
jgi:uncharacterized protein